MLKVSAGLLHTVAIVRGGGFGANGEAVGPALYGWGADDWGQLQRRALL